MNPQKISTLYKLIIMYMIEVTKAPLSNSDISDYILEKGYTDSIKLQVAISELIDDKMINASSMLNRTYLTLTKEGQETIQSLESRISPSIRSEIYEYLLSKASELNEKHSLQTSYSEVPGGYKADMVAKDKDGELFSLTLTFPTESLAVSACENFKKTSSGIYSYLISQLMK